MGRKQAMQGIARHTPRPGLRALSNERPQAAARGAASPDPRRKARPCSPGERVEATAAAERMACAPSHWRADLTGEWLTGACFAGADFREASLRNADLTDADLRGADLRRADLSGADLTQADLRGANLREARLKATRFRGALYDERTRWPAGFRPEEQRELLFQPSRREAPQAGHGTFWTVAGLVLAADQIAKVLARDFLAAGGSPRWLPGDVLFLQRVENHGLNFQVLEGLGPLLTLAMGLVLVAVLAGWQQLSHRGAVASHTLVGLALLFGGGLGNTIDRIAFGAVIDFVGIYGGPVINLADVAVLAGVLCLALTHRGNTGHPAAKTVGPRRPAPLGIGV